MDAYIVEDANRFWQGETHVKYDEAIAEKMRDIRQRLADDYLVLSDEFINCYKTGFSEMDEEERWDPVLGHESFSKDIRSLYPRLLAQARSEIAA